MAQIFSWKVATGKYAYLFKKNNSYIMDRIVDDATLFQWAADANRMTESEYASAFNDMKAEILSSYPNVVVGNYSDYYNFDIVSGLTSNVILLSGKDGVEYAGNNTMSGGSLTPAEWEILNAAIDEKFEDLEAYVSGMVEQVSTYVESAVTEDISEAMEEIAQTQSELEQVRADLNETAASAQEALDLSRQAISGSVDPETVQEILEGYQITEEWLSGYSGSVINFTTEYDATNNYLGGIGTIEDIPAGVLKTYCININAVSGTVGTVQRDMYAVSGVIYDFATWYNESASTMAEVSREVNASQAYIEDLILYVDNQGQVTNSVSQAINGQTASIVDEAKSYTNSAITSVEREINAFSGVVREEISRLDTISGETLVYMERKMDAQEGQIVQSMTIARGALSAATDVRESWTAESGILTTVSRLTIDLDTEGNPIWHFYPENYVDLGLEPVRVYEFGGKFYERPNGQGRQYAEDGEWYIAPDGTTRGVITPQYTTEMMSFINQNSDKILMSVSDSGRVAALGIELTDEGGSRIFALADEVILDADVIADAISAKTAMLGGIHLAYGEIWANNGSAGSWKISQDGTIYASNASISGNVYASNGYFSGEIQAGSGKIGGLIISNDSLSSSNGNFSITSAGTLNARDASITGDIYARNGSFSGDIYARSIILGSGAEIDGYATDQDVSDYVGDHSVLIDETYAGGGHSFYVSREGLLMAANAIISGNIYTTNGYFRGDVYANNGEFNGSITATSLTLGEDAHIAGTVYATQGKIGGLTINEDGSLEAENFKVTSGGSVYASDIIISNSGFNLTKKIYNTAYDFYHTQGGGINYSDGINVDVFACSSSTLGYTTQTCEIREYVYPLYDIELVPYDIVINEPQSIRYSILFDLTINAFTIYGPAPLSNIDLISNTMAVAGVYLKSYTPGVNDVYFREFSYYQTNLYDFYPGSPKEIRFEGQTSQIVPPGTYRLYTKPVQFETNIQLNSAPYTDWFGNMSLLKKSATLQGLVSNERTEIFYNGFGLRSNEENYFFTNRAVDSSAALTLEVKSNNSGFTLDRDGFHVSSPFCVNGKMRGTDTSITLQPTDYLVGYAGNDGTINVPDGIPVGVHIKVFNYLGHRMNIRMNGGGNAAFKPGSDSSSDIGIIKNNTTFNNPTGRRIYDFYRIEPFNFTGKPAGGGSAQQFSCTWVILEN